MLWDVGDLVPAAFSADDAAVESGERFLESHLDVVGLQASGPRLVHGCTQLVELRVGQMVRGQRPLVHQLDEAVADAGVDDFVHASSHLGLFAVLDGVHEEVPQRGLVEGLAQDVEDLAPVGLAHLVQLLQEAGEHGALAGVVGDEVPQPAHLGLADAVDATEPLLDAVGIPGKVVVDHQVRGLEVETLARGVGGHEDLTVAVLGERRPACRAAIRCGW